MRRREPAWGSRRLPRAPLRAGYSKAEVVGRNCRFLQGKDSDPAVVEDLRVATSPGAGHPCVVELINYRKDGSKFWNQVRRRAQCFAKLSESRSRSRQKESESRSRYG